MRRKKLMHFSHDHPLSEFEVKEEDQIICSCCELDLSGPAYKCIENECDFLLHKACFELPKKLPHKSHPAHRLTLLFPPPYDSSEFSCNACGESGTGFTYHCYTCNYDLSSVSGGYKLRPSFLICQSLKKNQSTMRRKKFMHFSHDHPLSESKVKEEDRINCSCCELGLSGPAYKCSECDNFFLHKACFELPQYIRHKSHPAHHLTLLSTPPDYYKFDCNACGHTGYAFTYHCSTCKYNLHVKCMSLPQSVTRKDHEHPINLCYIVDYDEQETHLVCDVCEKSIPDNWWVYCCSYCDFGTHLDCVTTEVKEEDEEEKEEEVEESGSGNPIASMNSLLTAQIEAQAHMQRMQIQMQANRQNAQFMHDIGRSMAYSAG